MLHCAIRGNSLAKGIAIGIENGGFGDDRFRPPSGAGHLAEVVRP